MLLVWRERRDFSFQDLAVSTVISKAKKRLSSLFHLYEKKKATLQNELFPSNKVVYE